MATIQEQLGQLLHLVGRLEGEVAAVRRDAETVRELHEEDRVNASASRRRIFDQMGELTTTVTKMEGDVKLVGLTAAQARDATQHLAKQFSDQDGKVMGLIRRIRRLEIRDAIFLSGVTAVGGFIWWAVTTNASAIWKAITGLLNPQ